MSAGTPVGLLYWYTTSAILCLLAIINLASKLQKLLGVRLRRRGQKDAAFTALPLRRAKEGDITEDPASHFARGLHKRIALPTRLARASTTAWTKYVLLSELPLPTLPWIRRNSRAIAATELAWTVGYTAGVLVLSFYDTNWDLEACAKQTGWMAIAQIPLIIALAGKNNLISILTGISYEKLNFLHRAAGRVCLIGSWLHTIGYIYLLGGVSLLQFQTSLTTWGMISILSLSLMYLSSIRAVRQRIYEFFLVAHICSAALFLAGVIMHWSAVSLWVYPGIGLWAADRLLRLTRLVFPSLKSKAPRSGGTISLLTPSTIKLTLPTTSSWKAGQHFFVLLPTLSRLPWETHPFTAAGIPGNGEVSFIVRVRDGMTGRMKAAIEAGGEGPVEGRVEGPYGGTKCLREMDGVVIFAGGSGISFAISHLLQIVADAKCGKTACRRVKIAWMVKSELHLNWIHPLLLPALVDLPSTIEITLHIYVTKRQPLASSLPVQSALPQHPTDVESGDWQTYLEDRASKPRMSSRMMSTTSWATFGPAGQGDTRTAQVSRRGSEVDLAGRRDSALSRSFKGDVEDMEKSVHGEEGSVLPIFNWSDGYGGSDFPAKTSEVGMSDAGRRPSGPISPLNRARFSSCDSSHSTMSSPSPSPSRPAFPVVPHARTRNISFVDQLPSPQRSQLSFGLGTATPPTRRKSSLATMSKADDETYDDEKFNIYPPDSPADLSVTLLSPTPINFSRPLPTSLRVSVGGLGMSRSSTADSFSSFTAHSQPLLPSTSHNSAVPSGCTTPSTPLPSLPSHSNIQNALGLERFVRWHTGRADPGEVVSQMKGELKKGRMEVMVCGPKSLLVAVKKATRDEMRVGEVWGGGVRVGFHAEDFGW